MKILVVEDDFVSRNVMVGAVEKLGHTCLVAEDGHQAWELFESEPCQVILSDWMMPGLSGLELCERVRQFESEEYCYFIILSSLDKKKHVLKGLQAGADDYLTKPLDLEELQARLLSASRVTSLHRNLLQAQSRAVLNSKLAAVGQLAAGVAHELNTPLGAIKMALDSALRRLDNQERVEKKLRLSLNAIRHMQGIISQLLDNSHMAPVQKSHCEMSQVARETSQLLDSLHRKADVELRLDLEEGVLVDVPASEFQQILLNLLTNAKEAALAAGSKGRTIFLSIERQDKMGVLRVSDQGARIPQSSRNRLFEPFYTTKPAGSGVGLGLTMVSNIVELRNGLIEVDPPGVELTTFEVKLPLRNS